MILTARDCLKMSYCIGEFVQNHLKMIFRYANVSVFRDIHAVSKS